MGEKLRESSGSGNWNIDAPQPPPSPTIHRIQLQTGMFENALRPSLEWYMLLAGLLTQVVLEGYLTAGCTFFLLLRGIKLAAKENQDNTHFRSEL